MSRFITSFVNAIKPGKTYPVNGDYIEITHLPSIHYGVPNAYIGMKGIVENMREDGKFDLNTGTSILVMTSNDYEFKKIQHKLYESDDIQYDVTYCQQTGDILDIKENYLNFCY